MTPFVTGAKLRIRDLSTFCMDHHSILDKGASQAGQKTVAVNIPALKLETRTTGAAAAPALKREALRFPGDDGGKSLSEMAQRDLDAALQLLAERAQYITGSSGAAIALRQGDTMICCASAGSSAPELGAHLQIDSGLSAESVRTRKTLRCDDAENDPRVNHESCRAFGIASVVVMPLVRAQEVYGVFELLSDRPHAFEERDFVALERLAEMIQTAVDHSDAAKRAEKELSNKPQAKAAATTAEPQTVQCGGKLGPASQAQSESSTKSISALAETAVASAKADVAATFSTKQQDTDQPLPAAVIEYGNVRTCAACGFPVSQGRKLCLDCEATNPDADPISDAPEFFGQLSDPETSWVRSHMYLIATVLLMAATIAVLVWRF